MNPGHRIRCGTHNLVLHIGDLYLFVLLKEGYYYDGCKHKVGEVCIGSRAPIFHSASQPYNYVLEDSQPLTTPRIFLCFEMVMAFESSGARVMRTRRGGCEICEGAVDSIRWGDVNVVRVINQQMDDIFNKVRIIISGL